MSSNNEARKASASEIRQDFAETVNRVAYSKESVVIERRGRPMAALIPYTLFQMFQDYLTRIEDELDAAAIADSAGEELIDFDVAVKEISSGRALPGRD